MVVTDAGAVSADTVVLATGIPFLDRGGYFARLEPQRSYAQAFRVPGLIPTGMYLSADSPTRSIRSVPHEDGIRVLVGGNGHTVGRYQPTSDRVADLTEWTKRHFPGAELTHAWSAQDYRAVDDLPYVGPLLPWSENVLFASGFAKWGMTNAVAAALALSSRLLGGATSWAQAFESWSPHELKGVFDAAKANASVVVELGKGWLRPKASPTVQPGDGEGVVERSGLRPVAVCAVDGRTSRMSAVCTHLGGVVTWNDAERSWDCPLHGSRFSADGAVLEGPATRDLAPAPQS